MGKPYALQRKTVLKLVGIVTVLGMAAVVGIWAVATYTASHSDSQVSRQQASLELADRHTKLKQTLAEAEKLYEEAQLEVTAAKNGTDQANVASMEASVKTAQVLKSQTDAVTQLQDMVDKANVLANIGSGTSGSGKVSGANNYPQQISEVVQVIETVNKALGTINSTMASTKQGGSGSGNTQTPQVLQTIIDQLKMTLHLLSSGGDAIGKILKALGVIDGQGNPTPVPTPTPSPQPTPSPTPAPTPQPTPNPTPSPTPTPTPTPSPLPTIFSSTQWNSSYARVVHSDVSQSVTLPNGKILWVGGDTTQVNGKSTVGGYGYPHSIFVTQTPGTLNFTAVPGSYGYGWQQVPNWSDNSWFWPSTPIVDNGTLYVLGERVKVGSPFTIVGAYVAEFNASTLAYKRIVELPGGATGTTTWGGVAKGTNGWWVTGTHPVPCSYATYCKVGDIASVPFGSIATKSNWTVHNNVIPATANVGTTMALKQTSTGWDIFTKVGDGYGGTEIERLQAASPTGPWTVNGKWPAPSPANTVTYGVAVHPEQACPANEILVSYNVNGIESEYYPRFLCLPL